MCNHSYFYLVDADFGPLFIKFAGYVPYTARACLNGHEYAKCQLRREDIAFDPLDNGIATCADPLRLQQINDTLDVARIEAVVRKWLARLPQPFTAAERAAGYDDDIAILQAEFARTQVFDRPLSGRHLFEEIIREHLDLGRPEQVSLIFDRRITRRTPERFRTRVITRGVTPSLHIDYKSTRIKQYFKEARALRTETTINDTRPRCEQGRPRAAPVQPARAAGHRLCRQPPCVGSRAHQPGLPPRRVGLRTSQQSPCR